jgi:hypothetical protein
MAILNQLKANVSERLYTDVPSLVTLISVSVALVPIAWILFDYVRILRLRRMMPPGPFPLPLIGNWYDFPKVRPWIEFQHMSKKFNSEMITLWNGRRPMIICNDAWSILISLRSGLRSTLLDLIWWSWET